MLSFLFEQEMTDNPKANAQCTLNDADREDQSSHNLNNQNTLRYDNGRVPKRPCGRDEVEWRVERGASKVYSFVLCFVRCALHA